MIRPGKKSLDSYMRSIGAKPKVGFPMASLYNALHDSLSHAHYVSKGALIIVIQHFLVLPDHGRALPV